MKGTTWIALGPRAVEKAKDSHATFSKHNRMLTHAVTSLDDYKAETPPSGLTDEQKAHWAKTRLWDLSPYDPSLYLDADTQVFGSLAIGFNILQRGWDLVMVPSVPPEPSSLLWNLSSKEKRYTMEQLGVYNHVMLNTGVMWFRKSDAIRTLFDAWTEEWLRFKDRDQGAFLRALRRNPVKLWILGYAYNSADGEFVRHLFGSARG